MPLTVAVGFVWGVGWGWIWLVKRIFTMLTILIFKFVLTFYLIQL